MSDSDRPSGESAPTTERKQTWPRGRYEPYVMDLPRVGYPLRFDVCSDCGAIVANKRTHDRFHAIGNHQAKAIGVLVVSHIAEHVHDRYDVRERIGDNPAAWVGHAELARFAEEIGDAEPSDNQPTWPRPNPRPRPDRPWA